MDSQDGLEQVNELLNKRYGVDLLDVGEDAAKKALDDGEEPEAIVEWYGRKYDLVRIDKGLKDLWRTNPN